MSNLLLLRAPDPRETKLGLRIRDLRDGLGLSRRELAKRAGISRSTLQHIEETDGATVHSLLALCRALECSPNYLLQDWTENRPPEKSSTTQQKL